MSRQYFVTWEIDVFHAEDPVDAARQALDALTRPDSTAHVFGVRQAGQSDDDAVEVDLDAVDGHPEVGRPELVLSDGTRWDYDRGEWITPEVAG